MTRTLSPALALLVLLAGCYAPAPTDAQVQAVAATCKEKGMVARVFIGTTSQITCEKP